MVKKKLRVCTYGSFEVYVGDRPIIFRNRKAKELLAFCIDRRGKTLTSDDVSEYLWSNRPFGENIRQLYRRAARDLTKTLNQEGLEGVFIRTRGKCRVQMEEIDCDLIRYLDDHNAEPADFAEMYLYEYEWRTVLLSDMK